MAESKPVWPSTIVTWSQAQECLRQLEEYRVWLKSRERSTRVGVATAPPKPTLSPVTELLLGGKTTVVDLDRLIDAFEKRLLKSPVLHVTLPTLPNAEVKAALASWFRQNVAPDALLEFIADRELSGGMVLRTRNHLYNFSLRRQLWDNRTLIPEIIRRA